MGTRAGGETHSAGTQIRQHDWDAPSEDERKKVTILFADICGSTQLVQSLDPEQALDLLEPVLAAMQVAVRNNGGTVVRVEGDGILAVFGAPLAIEDHALCACRAALNMLDAHRRAGNQEICIRLGIDTGEIVLQAVRDGPIVDYRPNGPLLHVAHRLQSIATPGKAYLSLATQRLAGTSIKTRALGPSVLRGFDAAIEVFELEDVFETTSWDRRRSAGALSRFVGRRSELALLASMARTASRGRGSVVAILGHAGIGKSRLVHEFRLSQAGAKWMFWYLSGLSSSCGIPFFAAASLVRAIIGAAKNEDAGTVVARLAGAGAELGCVDPIEAAALRALLDLPPDDQRWPDMTPEQRRSFISKAVCQFVLRAAARAPSVIILEDMHWIDQESRSIFDEIVGSAGATSLMLVVTSRPEWMPAWTARRYVSVVHLAPLDDLEAEELLSGLLGTGSEATLLSRRLIDRAGGGPLFLEEMTRHLTEHGVIHGAGTRVRSGREMQDLEIPDSIAAILDARIDRLGTEERALLQLASVIGRQLPVALLGAVAKLPDAVLGERLAALQKSEFLYESHSAAALEYNFTHALTHVAAYGSMMIRRRRELHRRVLSTMETLFVERIDDLVEVLADHAINGEEWAKGLKYCLKAGQAANSVCAHHDAIPFFEKALVALENLSNHESAERLEIEIRMGLRVALAATADLRRIRECLSEADRLAEKIGDQRALVRIRSSACTVCTVLGDIPAAVADGTWAYEVAPAVADEGLGLGAAFALAQALLISGKLDQTEAILFRHQDRYRVHKRYYRTETTGTLSILMLTTLAMTRWLTGDAQGAGEAAGEAKCIANETRLNYDLSYASLGCGLAAFAQGDADRAVETLNEALLHCRGGRLKILFPSIARFLGQAYAAADRGAEAVPIVTEALVQSRTMGLALFQAWCGVSLASALLNAGDLQQAQDAAEEAVRIARERAFAPILVQALRVSGDVAATGGLSPQAATDFHHEAIDLAQRMGICFPRFCIAGHPSPA